MGKNQKNKKKPKGAEKTAAKTDKKLSNKMKKELEAIGEDNIEDILAQIESEEKRRQQCVEKVIEKPTRRVNFTFIPHPDKEELVLYGGEFFDGQKTYIYNDLMFYNIPNNTWSVFKAPNGPPPRCGHQMVATSANKGQLWLFGGEFASPTQSQFYHYRDLWVYHISNKQWEKINASNGPSARSGHRMILVKKQIFLFGGFHDNLRDYKYFNDLYCFDIETYKWNKIEPSGNAPVPRSGCCMVPLPEGKILIYGGYSKEKLKKDVDKGHVHSDAYILQPDKNDTTGTKYKWVHTKMGGIQFSPRCSMTMVQGANNQAYTFGGVFDVEKDDEDIAGNFYNDMFNLDLEKIVWRTVLLLGKKDKENKSRRKNDVEELEENETTNEKIDSTTISDDGIFKVTISNVVEKNVISNAIQENKYFQPQPRINCGIAIKRGTLYLYGGLYEDGSKQITLQDFYALDLKKLDEWKILIDDDKSQEWLGSESESESTEEESDEDDDDDKEDDGDGDDEAMDTS